MCSTPGTVFSWFGAIFINISFGLLIGWGVTVQWIIGFFFSFVYSCILFAVSFKLSKRVVKDTASPEVVGDNEEEVRMTQTTATASAELTNQGLRTLVTLLFTLAVVSVGVTGLIIPLNLFYCDYGDGYSYYNDKYITKTNVSSFPNDVQNWYESIQNRSIDNGANFATLPTGLLVFTGNNATDLDITYSYDGSTVTALQRFKNPSSFVVTNDNLSICMSGYVEGEGNIQSSSTIACYDGTSLRYITNYNVADHEFKDFYSPAHLYPSTNHTIWFMASSYDSYLSSNSRPVFSLDDETMALTLHSTLERRDEDEIMPAGCDKDRIRRYRALVSIFTSILPTFITAILLMTKFDSIPTMPIIIYISITSFIVSFILSVQPSFDYTDLVMKIWLSGTSGAWMAQMIVAFLLNRVSTERPQKQASFVWSIHFTSLLFFFSMTWSLGIPFPYYDNWWRWVLINFIVYIPYIFFGVVIEKTLLVILGALGIFADAWKFSSVIATYIDSSFQIFIQVILFALIGILLGFFGWKINQYQEQVQASVRAWTSRKFAPFVRRRTNNADQSTQETNDIGPQNSVSSEENDCVHTAVTIL